MEIVIHLISGAVGGNLVGAILKARTFISTLMGLVGGAVGHYFGDEILKQIGVYADGGALAEYGTSVGLGAVLGIVGRFFGRGGKKD